MKRRFAQFSIDEIYKKFPEFDRNYKVRVVQKEIEMKLLDPMA